MASEDQGRESIAPEAEIDRETSKDDLWRRVEQVLDRIRPFIQMDGGDVELVDVDPTSGIAQVHMVGACETCAISTLTIKAGIERALIEEVPEIRLVIAV